MGNKNEQEAMRYTIPATLDDLPKFLWWDFDQALLFLSIMLLGLISNFILTGIVLAGIAGWAYGKTKSGRHRAYVVHMMYWYFPSDLTSNYKVTPPSYERDFLG